MAETVVYVPAVLTISVWSHTWNYLIAYKQMIDIE